MITETERLAAMATNPDDTLDAMSASNPRVYRHYANVQDTAHDYMLDAEIDRFIRDVEASGV